MLLDQQVESLAIIERARVLEQLHFFGAAWDGDAACVVEPTGDEQYAAGALRGEAPPSSGRRRGRGAIASEPKPSLWTVTG